MQSWESFTNRYPRLRLSSFLSRKGIKSFDDAVAHFRAMGVEPNEEVLRKIYEVAAKSEAPQETESSPDLSGESADGQPEIDENDKDVQAPKPTRRRTSRRKKSDTEVPK